MAPRAWQPTLVAVAILALGYVARRPGGGRGSGPAPSATGGAEVARVPEAVATPGDRPGAPRAVGPSSWDEVLGASEDRSDSIDDLVSQHRLGDKRRALRAIFPPTEIGRTLADIATLFPWSMGDEHVAEATAGLRRLGKLAARQAEAVAALRASLGRLPDEYAAERQFLVQQVGRLVPDSSAAGADPNARLAMLDEEMRRPVAPATEGGPSAVAFFNPAIALDTLAQIEGTQSPEAFEATVRAAISAQQSPEVRELMMSRYQANVEGWAFRARRRSGF
jgi:hypothetical protein